MSRRPRPTGAIHVVTNRRQGKGREYVTHLLRRSYRQGGKVKNETVGNISHLPDELVELVRAGLRGEPVGVLSDAFAIERSLPAGHVLAALSMARRLELAKRLAPELKPQSENLLRLLVEHQRTTEMQAIRRDFERMADEASGLVDVTLTSAVELAEADRRRYERELAERLGRQVRIHYRRDPELIGGALIQIGDRVVDGSVRSQLQRLRQALAG